MIVFNVKTAPKETTDLVRHRRADAAFGTERVRSGLPLPRQHGDHTGGEGGRVAGFRFLCMCLQKPNLPGRYFWQEQLCFILIPTPAHPPPKPI